MLKSVQKKLNSIASEETEFVEKIRNHFPGPAHRYMESPFLNQVL
jgi:hypothetical protein